MIQGIEEVSTYQVVSKIDIKKARIERAGNVLVEIC